MHQQFLIVQLECLLGIEQQYNRTCSIVNYNLWCLVNLQTSFRVLFSVFADALR